MSLESILTELQLLHLDMLLGGGGGGGGLHCRVWR